MNFILDDQKLKEILLRENYVVPEDVKRAEEFASAHHGSFVDYLFSENLISGDLLGQAIAESFDLPYADLEAKQPTRDEVLKIPEAIAKKHHVVFFKEDDGGVTVATDNPMSAGLREDLESVFNPPLENTSMVLTKRKIIIAYALGDAIEATFVHYRQGLATRFMSIIKEKKRIAPEIIEEIIEDALRDQASDIHFEPQETEVIIRFRIDGTLHEAGRIPKEHYENILNRIKVQARLRIDEHFSAQDGAIRFSKGDTNADMRVSVVPIMEGEKVVIRMLAEYMRSLTFQDLGLSSSHQAILRSAARKPFGMILVTGPTGSGKTTTLYALLKVLNQPGINITTIEDPVEYKIAGVNQIQVNMQTNLTFASGLRSIIRQDPNIVLVGEIRDRETAEIGVNAALTGHLLLSTFHANDAATAIPRLIEMDVEPFLLASTLELVVAQRLVRRVCKACRYSTVQAVSTLRGLLPSPERYFHEESVTLYRGKGCNACNHSGFKGRVGIFEFISITPELRELILKNPSSAQIAEFAQKHGSQSLFEDGIEKVKSGVTTLEELLRVSEPPR